MPLTAKAFLSDDFNRDFWTDAEFEAFIKKATPIVAAQNQIELKEIEEDDMLVCDWAVTASDEEKQKFIEKFDR